MQVSNGNAHRGDIRRHRHSDAATDPREPALLRCSNKLGLLVDRLITAYLENNGETASIVRSQLVAK